MERELLEGEARVGPGENSYIMTSREWAADILITVSAFVRNGGFPNSVSAFDLGRAIGRAQSNSNEDDPYGELCRGYEHYLKVKQTVKE